MARTAIPITQCVAPYAAAPVAAVWTVLDGVDGGDFVATGRELVLVRNTNAAARTVTADSTADVYGRTGDQVSAALAQNAHAVFGPLPLSGWVRSNGRVNIDVSGAGVEAIVLRLP